MKLFHYTSINNLALILQSKSIRFGRMDKVNDPTEGESSDFHSLAPYCFISSWTANQDEEFAFWNMYTPQMRGVRLELELPIFNSHQVGGRDWLISPKECFADARFMNGGGPNEPFQIEYTNEEEKLKPPIVLKDVGLGNNLHGLNINLIGRCKRIIWSFEQEYRFIIHMVPANPSVNPNSNNGLDLYADSIIRGFELPIEGYLIPIAQPAFSKMIIRTGPKILAGDFEIIQALIEKHNPTAILEGSLLSGLVR